MNALDLTGEALDHAVAIALGWEQRLCGAIPVWHKKGVEDSYRGRVSHWKPSTNWEQGGKIIERQGIAISPHYSDNGAVTNWYAGKSWAGAFRWSCAGETALVAAMRCFVASKFPKDS